jgi:sulfur carrier protein
MGIEPTALPWEGRVLPLYDARVEGISLARPTSLPVWAPNSTHRQPATAILSINHVISGYPGKILTYTHFLGSSGNATIRRPHVRIPASCRLKFQARILIEFPVQMKSVNLVINGEPRAFQDPLNVSGLVELLGYAGKRVAIERNGEIVPRSTHERTVLLDGDKLEIVVAVGGG